MQATPRRLTPQLLPASAEGTKAARAHFDGLLAELLPKCASLDAVLSDQRFLCGVLSGFHRVGAIDFDVFKAWQAELTAACNARLVELRQAKALAA